MKKSNLNCLDLFAGGGGLTEGFYSAGFNTLAHVEKDENACLTLKTRNAYHWLKEHNKIEIYEKYLRNEITREVLYNSVPNYIIDNVLCVEMTSKTRKETFATIDNIIGNQSIDIIIGGPPCQAYSVIGRSRDENNMLNDKRKYLYKEYIKYIKKYEPTMYVFENVTGLLSSTDEKGKPMIEKIKNAFKHIGYTFEYRILNSSEFGVLQDRKRIIICGWKKNIPLRYPEFVVKENHFNLNDLFSDLPHLNSNENSSVYSDAPGEAQKKLNIRYSNWNILTQHNARYLNNRDKEIYKIFQQEFKNNKRRLKYQELPNNLKTHKNESSFQDRFKVLNGYGISHTMVAHISKDGHHYIHPDPNQTRSITVREAARIQSFPDDYYFESSRTSAFTQIGNAVPPLMAKEIALGCKNILQNN